MKIGVMFGNPETTTGGNALKFYASVRLDIRRIGSIKKGEEVIGSETKVKVVKNKVAPPFKQAGFDILYGEGISREGEVLDLGSELNIVEKSGAWYSYGGDRIGQGKDNAREYLRANPAMAFEIENKIRAAKGVALRGRGRRRRLTGADGRGPERASARQALAAGHRPACAPGAQPHRTGAQAGAPTRGRAGSRRHRARSSTNSSAASCFRKSVSPHPYCVPVRPAMARCGLPATSRCAAFRPTLRGQRSTRSAALNSNARVRSGPVASSRFRQAWKSVPGRCASSRPGASAAQ